MDFLHLTFMNQPMKKISPAFLSVCMILFSCQKKSTTQPEAGYLTVAASVKNLSNALIEDHFNPPVAMRHYAYACLAGYEALVPYSGGKIQSFAGRINGLPIGFMPEEIPDSSQIHLDYVFQEAFALVARKYVYTESMIDSFLESRRSYYSEKLDEQVFLKSKTYASDVAARILEYANRDMYRETRNYPEYVIQTDLRFWQPTGPDYLPATEPYWNLIRPFFLDSAAQVHIPPPTPYDTSKGSKFRAELEDVMYQMNDSTPEKLWIANFWDCNPNMSHRVGHVIFFTQKMTPGGHWLHIALQANEQQGHDLFKSAEITTMLCMTLHDAFIACWDEKYRSNYIRPETLIKIFFDKNWLPVLQTPAFPEYPSGHSVVSAAAASVLTQLIGDQFAFTDSTEARFNIPNRSFRSFREAAEEAAISRVYGGIHYRPAIENGKDMGNQVGMIALNKAGYKKMNP